MWSLCTSYFMLGEGEMCTLFSIHKMDAQVKNRQQKCWHASAICYYLHSLIGIKLTYLLFHFQAFAYFGYESPFMVQDFQSHFPGGVKDMATSDVWKQAICDERCWNTIMYIFSFSGLFILWVRIPIHGWRFPVIFPWGSRWHGYMDNQCMETSYLYDGQRDKVSNNDSITTSTFTHPSTSRPTMLKHSFSLTGVILFNPFQSQGMWQMP